MKILLVAMNAKYIHSNLALYSLYAYAGEYRKDVELAEYTINNSREYILENIYKRKPDVLCFSCYIWNIEYVKEIAGEFHKLCPDIPIWVGGPEVSYEVEAFLSENPQITGVMIGEGERTFRELAAHYVDNSPEISDICGLAYQKGHRVVFTGIREPMDMNEIPFCYEHMEDFSNRIIYYESSRGCPFNCSYCLSSIDKKLRFRNIDTVKRELQFFLDKKVPQVKFVDRTFNCRHEHAMAIWEYIREHDNGVTNFHFEISADLLNDAELELISGMRPGLIQLEVGVQSTNEVTIREIHRTMKLEEVKRIVKKVQSYANIHEHLDLIAGLPYEDYASFSHSFDEIYALKPNQLQLGFLKVLKGSFMYEHAGEYGILYHEHAPYEVMKTNWLSFDEVLEIKQVEEMLEVYYNSGQFEVSIKLLETLFHSAFDMFRALGAWYEKNGLFAMSHSRLRRCEIILEYLRSEERFFHAIPIMEEALLFDLYYRENCKTRPSWAVDAGTFKKETRALCPNGKMQHVEPVHYIFPGKEVRNLNALPKREEKTLWVRFDYSRRDPLDHQAHVEYVELETEERS